MITDTDRCARARARVVALRQLTFFSARNGKTLRTSGRQTHALTRVAQVCIAFATCVWAISVARTLRRRRRCRRGRSRRRRRSRQSRRSARCRRARRADTRVWVIWHRGDKCATRSKVVGGGATRRTVAIVDVIEVAAGGACSMSSVDTRFVGVAVATASRTRRAVEHSALVAAHTCRNVLDIAAAVYAV